MAVNKVVSGNKTLIDISDSTVASNQMLKGTVAYGANGEKVNGTIEAVDRANIVMISALDDDKGDTIVIDAYTDQATGYVIGGNGHERKTISLSVSGKTVTATDGEHTSISKSIAEVTQATPTITTTADEEDDEIWLRATTEQAEGYVKSGTKYVEAHVKLTVSGNKATMSSGNASISRTIGTFETWVFEMKDGTTIEKVVNVD